MVVLSLGWVGRQDGFGKVRLGDLKVEQKRYGRNVLRGGISRWGRCEVRRSRVSLSSRTVSGWHEHFSEGRVAAERRPERNVGHSPPR